MDTLIIVVLVISVLLNFLLIWRLYAMLTLIEGYQNDIIALQEHYYSSLEGLLDNMRRIDASGAFESDDEVGSTFTELKTIIEQYYTDGVDGEKEQ